MSDQVIRAIQRTYLKGEMSADLFLLMLDRYKIKPAWDWVAGGMRFYDLPLKKKVSIFLEKWPSNFQALDRQQIHDITAGTGRIGDRVIWRGAPPDAPSVDEILNATLGDLAYYYGTRTAPLGGSFSNFIAEEVYSAQHYIWVLQSYNLIE